MQKTRSCEEKEKLCEEWKRSGLSQREFSRRSNINVSSLNLWIKTFKGGNGVAANEDLKPIKFLPIGNIVAEKILLEIATPSGVNIKTYLPEGQLNLFLEGLLKWK